jgi:hypothetical protein
MDKTGEWRTQMVTGRPGRGHEGWAWAPCWYHRFMSSGMSTIADALHIEWQMMWQVWLGLQMPSHNIGQMNAVTREAEVEAPAV